VAAPLTFQAPLTMGAQIEARAAHATAAESPFLLDGSRVWTYRQYRNECVRTAHLVRRRLGPCDETRPGHVAVLLDNHLEMLALVGACGYLGFTLFGVNTGLRGDTLAGVLNHSRARLVVLDERYLAEFERIRSSLKHVAAENVLIRRDPLHPSGATDDLEACLRREVGGAETSLDAPVGTVRQDTNLMVIYTSGTTGLPKGINNNHFKLLVTGLAVSRNLELGSDAVGYACMPLFHSNAMFLGFSPAFWVGGKLVLRERFSASNFVPDVLRYGVSYWNYVGEPVHYILNAIEREYAGDEKRILEQVARNPRNRLQYALGNGASPPDIDRFTRWLGLDDMFELYGSTEAAISTFRKKTDPRGSVGEITDPAVKILNERGKECPAANLGPDGKILNYADAVGEICRTAEDTGLFQGYFDNPEANTSKYRSGVYHSGDLGHVLICEGKRFLFFDGRTDDWIRKDGENFSAAQVARHVAEYPDVMLAAAYGVPCSVSDELVMVALKLRPGASFAPQGFFDFCERQVAEGGMDRKWIPDFVRIVDDFEYTQTQKILVRTLKKEHFHRGRLEDAPLYWRRRGDTTFSWLSAQDFERLRAEFAAAERADLLERF